MLKEQIDFWFDNNFNIALIGSHGCGKTSIILDAWKRKGIVGKYFNGPTMDPFIDLIGVPRVKNDNGSEYLDFIKPKDLNYESLESIFVDEPNRSSKKVRDALLELILFKSVNGVPFPKLRNVIIAFNPPHDNEVTYDVDELDPAFLDRFHAKVNFPFECNIDYFRDKFGDKIADPAIEWWREIPIEIRKKALSPRRLDMALSVFMKGGDISYSLPKEVEIHSLLKRIDSGSILEQIRQHMNENNYAKSTQFFKNKNNQDLIISYMKEDNQIQDYYTKFLSSEKLSAYWSEKSQHKTESPYEIIVGDPKIHISSEFGEADVISCAISVAKNLSDAKFRARINNLFYSAHQTQIIRSVQDDVHKAVCLLSTTVPWKELSTLDYNHYVGKSLALNTLYENKQIDSDKKKEYQKIFNQININQKTTSNQSCLFKKYEAVKKQYGLS